MLQSHQYSASNSIQHLVDVRQPVSGVNLHGFLFILIDKVEFVRKNDKNPVKIAKNSINIGVDLQRETSFVLRL